MPLSRLRVAALAAALASTAAAQGARDSLGIVTTHHVVTVRGRTLRYTARAGLIPIRDNETGSVHGRMFFIAYTLDRAAGAPPRPITFAWNGGPGSSSSLVHLLGFGPKRLDASGTVRANDDTWLTFTDLVFVDPVGTGYSRPETAAYGAEFYSNRGDAESVAEFIRVYLQRAEQWDAPVFLAGESFGVLRAARVAEVLVRHHTRVRGVVLLGLALPVGALSPAMQAALALPTYTAAAFANKMLAPPLSDSLDTAIRAARAWALEVYAPALARLDALTPAQRDSIRAQLARYTGVQASRIDEKTLVIPLEQFSVTLLRERGQVLGRYDTRMTGPLDTLQKEFDPTIDPSLKSIIDDRAVVRYLRDELGYASDLRYQGPFGGGYPPPTSFRGDWMSVKWNWKPAVDSTMPADSMPPLERAMRSEPALRVLAVCGWYDLMCDVAGNEQLAARADSAFRARIAARGVGGGHAVYTDAGARRVLTDEVAAFFAAAQR